MELDHAWLLAVTENGNWRLGIGDPTPIGWFTVAAYLAAVVACGRVLVLERRKARAGRPASVQFWTILTAALLFLGINKQLDLQTLLNDVGRRTAKEQGWYPNRRIYQVLFIALVAASGVAVLGVFCWLARRAWRRNFLALLGTVFLFVFVLTRASSIHHVDIALQVRFAGLKWNWILELGGIAIVLAGALLALRAEQRDEAEGSSAIVHEEPIGPRKYSYRGGTDGHGSR